MSNDLEGIDAVLSDRLRELGMDFVADVLEGKRRPSTSQIMFLQTGRVVSVRQQSGTLLVGGSRDGQRVPADPEKQYLLTVPVPVLRRLLPPKEIGKVPPMSTRTAPSGCERITANSGSMCSEA